MYPGKRHVAIRRPSFERLERGLVSVPSHNDLKVPKVFAGAG